MSQVSYQRLERATPESQGIASESILTFVEAIEKRLHEVHSFMLLRHGWLVAEGWWSPYRKEQVHSLFSLSKSFTATAIVLAIEEGLFSLDDKVVSFFPDDLPATVSDNLAKMSIKHLLSMASGHDNDTMGGMVDDGDGNWARGFLSLPVPHEPGSHFVYNTGATYMLSAILQKTTGLNLLQFLEPRLFRPLGIEGATWEACPRGITVGGFGLSIKTEDIVVFGQLYLQKGIWEGKRILSEAWVKEATSYQISNGDDKASDWAQGYGYQFWQCRHNAYRGDGAFGQYCIVMPEQDAVLVITAGLGDMQLPLNIVWEMLLPAMKEGIVPENELAHKLLNEKLSNLSISPVQGNKTSAIAGKVSAKTYQLESNVWHLESLSLEFKDDSYNITIKTPHKKEVIACAYGKWQESISNIFNDSPVSPATPIAVSGAWQSDSTFKMVIRFHETPFYQTLVFAFDDDSLKLETLVNVGFAPPSPLHFVGHVV